MKISKGVPEDLPSKHLIYGVEGVGKTSLASTYPKPIFIDFEQSTLKMDVSRLEVTSYSEYVEACNIINSEEGDDFRTVVFDTTDWLENIVIREVLREDCCESITDHKYSFGAGDNRIEEFFRGKIIPSFDRFLKSGKNIVLVAHAQIKGIDDPIIGRYDHYTLKMGKKSSAIMREWADNVFFLNYDQKIKYEKGIGKNRAVGGNDVFIHTQRTAQYNAKRRDKIDDKIRFIEGENPYNEIIGSKEIIKADLLEGSEEYKKSIKYLSGDSSKIRWIKKKYNLSQEVEEKLLSV